MYGRFTSGMFASVLESNNQEALAHLASLDGTLVFITSAMSLLLFVFTIKIENNTKVDNKTKLMPYMMLLCLCIAVVAATEVKSHGIKGTRISESSYRADGEELIINLFSANANTLMLASLYEYRSLNALETTQAESRWSGIKRLTPAKDIYVVIIGESANRDRFKLYGYHRDTSDALADTDHITLVTDPLSASVVTRTSIPRSFYVNDVDTIDHGLNIIDLAKQSGSKTYWISNQGVVGNHDTPITAIAKHTDTQKFLNSNYELARSDMVFTKELALILKETHLDDSNILNGAHANEQQTKQISSKLVFLHTMGSHNDFCDRIEGMPLRLEPKELDTAEECYDNSILNTYHLITELKTQLDDSNLSYKMLYFSDHGLVEIKRSPYLSHGSGKLFSRQALEVPLLFISQKPLMSAEQKAITARYYLSDFPHTFADWLGVTADQIDFRRSVINPKFDPNLQPGKVFDDSFRVQLID